MDRNLERCAAKFSLGGDFFEAGNPSSTQFTVAIEAAAAKMNLQLECLL
jgi:hypothetical protein